MKTSNYVCNICEKNTKKSWVSIMHNNEIHNYCCYDCYKTDPVLVPSESKFKSTGEEKVVIPNVSIKNNIEKFNLLNLEEVNNLSLNDYQLYNEVLNDIYIDSCEQHIEDNNENSYYSDDY